MRHSLYAGAACLLASALAQATTLVALWTPEAIYLGADSRMVTNQDGPSASACKIAREGSTYFAISGLVRDDESGFSAEPLLHASLKQPGAIQEKVQRVLAAVSPSLERAVEAVKRDSPADYKYLLSGKPVLQAILADMIEGKPVLALAGFQLGPDGALRAQVSMVDGADARGPRVVFAGQQGRIRDYLRTHQDWLGADRGDVVRGLVQLEVDANSAWVGGPVDVLEVGGAGARWLQKKPACTE